MLQIHTVSLPIRVVGLGKNLNGLTGCFKGMTGNGLAILVGHCFQFAALVRDFTPSNLVAQFGFLRIGLPPEALAVKQ